MRADDVLYRETQTHKPWWMWLACLAPAALAWAAFLAPMLGAASGPPRAVAWFLLLVVGVLLPAFIFLLRLTVEVTPGWIVLRYRPIWTTRIRMDDIVSAEPRTYRPIAEYLGWGIRYAFGGGWAWTLAGNRGVQLVRNDGSRLLVGSADPERLAKEVREAGHAAQVQAVPA